MEKLSMRIRARAIRRAGELLKMFDGKPGPKKESELRGGTPPQLSSRKEVGQNAGMSKRQIRESVRLANIPTNDFEQSVESENPPTITSLSEQGKKKMSDSEKAAYDYMTKGKTRRIPGTKPFQVCDPKKTMRFQLMKPILCRQISWITQGVQIRNCFVFEDGKKFGL